MTDPFSISAAAIGLIDVLLRTSRRLYEDLVRLRGISHEVQNLVDAIRVWQTTSQDIRALAVQYSASAFASEDGFTFDGVFNALQACETAFSDIENMVTVYNRQRELRTFKFARDVKWIFDERKLRSAQSRFDQSRRSLLVAFGALSW